MINTQTMSLINGLNEVSYEHQELITVAVDYYEQYKKAHNFQSNTLNKLWGQPEFLQQCVLCVREALILATATITLDESVNFEEIINGCFNFDSQKHHLTNMKLNPIENTLSVSFFNSLRKAVFQQVFDEQSNLQASSDLSSETLTNRAQLFNQKFA